MPDFSDLENDPAFDPRYVRPAPTSARVDTERRVRWFFACGCIVGAAIARIIQAVFFRA